MPPVTSCLEGSKGCTLRGVLKALPWPGRSEESLLPGRPPSLEPDCSCQNFRRAEVLFCLSSPIKPLKHVTSRSRHTHVSCTPVQQVLKHTLHIRVRIWLNSTLSQAFTCMTSRCRPPALPCLPYKNLASHGISITCTEHVIAHRTCIAHEAQSPPLAGHSADSGTQAQSSA